MMSSVVEEFSDKYQGRCIFLKIDVDKSEARPPFPPLLHRMQHCV